MIAIFVIFLLLGEVVRVVSARGRKEEFTAAWARRRSAAERVAQRPQASPIARAG